jgi:hypothetical protein
VVPVTEQTAICHSESEYVLNLKRVKKKRQNGGVFLISCVSSSNSKMAPVELSHH